MKMHYRFFVLIVLSTLSICSVYAQSNTRWHITDNGGIQWNVSPHDNHTDHVEMSGKRMSCILTYGTDAAGKLLLSKKLIFPLLRTIPNNTHASLTLADTFNIVKHILVDGKHITEKPQQFYQKGYLSITCVTGNGIKIIHSYYPSVDKAAFIEQLTFYNNTKSALSLSVPANIADVKTLVDKGVDGAYILHTEIIQPFTSKLKPGEKADIGVVWSARKQADSQLYISPDYEFERRKSFITSLSASLVLTTPNQIVNKMFEFAKFRLTESIFDTKGGLMHSPGGGPFYAAIWANDQAEYVNPLFPFLGNAEGNESAINSYRLFATYMNPDYNPIPSSIIAEGIDTWHGAGDRGDQAMIAYGASRFALAYGDYATAQKLWPLIEWCLSYLEKKKNPIGVIGSDSDELEGRFPSGKINLATNSLAYGALINASRLAEALGKTAAQKKYLSNANLLKQAIEKYFGSTVEGFKTYRYYDGNNKLRAWICLPLVMGITNRKEETARALLSPNLWTNNGILTESGSKTFWDRATLYAFRGLYNAGFTDTATKYLEIYSNKRLLNDHVPYAIEAWPEGDKRQLSAESGLYCRAITEGLFGIEPLGFKKFSINPVLPKKWNQMLLQHIKAFNGDISISVFRISSLKQRIKIYNNGQLVKDLIWDRRAPIMVNI